jgi:hypothetical protein
MRTYLAIAFALIAVPLTAAEPQGLIVVLPDLKLRQGAEFVESIRIDVECGHIESVAAIPIGWEISIVRLGPGSEKLEATADHGATRLAKLGRFASGIRVKPEGSECFSVSALVHISGEADREVRLSKSMLGLKP